MKLKDLKESNIVIPRAAYEELLRKVKRDEDFDDDEYELMYDFVMDYDPSWMPYGTQKARTGDPYNCMADNMEEVVDAMEKYVK